MTTFDRFDPFERRIGAAMDDIVGTRQLDYLDDVFRQTARTSQRPRWSFPERWFNVDTTFARPVVAGRRVQFRMLLLLVVLAALLASAAVYFGSQQQLPAPYGPANNGQIIYGADGDLFVRDTVTGEPRLLLAAPGEQSGVVLSPNGLLISYDDYSNVDANGNPYEWVANIDGTNPRQILDVPYTFDWFEWGPDSQSIAIVTRPGPGVPQLWIAPADGSGARRLEFDGFHPWGVTWDPIRPDVLLVRGEDRKTHLTDLYYVTSQGDVLEHLGMAPLNLNGPEWELSGMAFTPDGQTIAYNEIVAEEYPVNRYRVHLMNRDGTNRRAIAAPLETDFSQAWPAISPDGSLVLMDSWETLPGNNMVFQLSIAPTDGSAPAHRLGPILEDDNLVKTWSPDGSRIILCGCEHRELYSIDPITGTSEKLPWQSDLPGWQRVAK